MGAGDGLPFNWTQSFASSSASQLVGYLYGQPLLAWTAPEPGGGGGPTNGETPYHYQAFFYLGACGTIPAIPTGLHRWASTILNSTSAWSTYVNGGSNNDFEIHSTGTWKTPSAADLYANDYSYSLTTATGEAKYDDDVFRRLRGADSGATLRVWNDAPGVNNAFGTGKIVFGPSAKKPHSDWSHIFPGMDVDGANALQIYTAAAPRHVYGAIWPIMDSSVTPDWYILDIISLYHPTASKQLGRAEGPVTTSASWHNVEDWPNAGFSGARVRDPQFTVSGEVVYLEWTSSTAPANPPA